MTQKEIDEILAKARAMDIQREAFEFASKMPSAAPEDLGPCSRCHENTGYSWDEYEKDWMSECCHAPAVGPDQHLGANYKPGHDSDLAF